MSGQFETVLHEDRLNLGRTTSIVMIGLAMLTFLIASYSLMGWAAWHLLMMLWPVVFG